MLHIAMGKGITFRMNSRVPIGGSRSRTTAACWWTGRCRQGAGGPGAGRHGARPNTDGLGLEAVGRRDGENGAIPVDEYSRPASPIDLCRGRRDRPGAADPGGDPRGQAFADTVFGGKPRTVDHSCIPSAVFSQPPMAGVGLTEQQARDTYGKREGLFIGLPPDEEHLQPPCERGLYKMIVDEGSDPDLGIHMIGPEAPEILQAAAIAVKAGLTKQDFDDTVALHPSMAEELVLLK
jgi:glutathione reductase (NADPH)